LTCWHHVVNHDVNHPQYSSSCHPETYHVFRFLFFRLCFGGAEMVLSPLSSPCIFLFADIVTDDEPEALLCSPTVASATLMLGRAPRRIKHETKKPFVKSSPGEHRKTASVAVSSKIPGCPRRGHSGSTTDRGASLNPPAVASIHCNAAATTCSFSSGWILHVEYTIFSMRGNFMA